MLNAGVIGIGAMGRHHARHYFNFPDVKLVAIVDKDKRRESLARRYECRFYRDYKEMLEKERIDLVSVAVPTTLHEEVAVDVLNKGINALVEKPISCSLESAERIVKAARKNDVKLMVGQIERFNPVIRKLKELVDRKELGDVISIDVRRLAIYHPRVRDCGVIIDLGIHDIDLMNYLLEEKVKSVYAIATHKLVPKPEFEDYANILLAFKNGVIGRIEVSWISPIKVREINVSGTKNCCRVDSIQQKIEVMEAFLETTNHFTWEDYEEFIKKFSPKVKTLQERNVEPLSIELREFIDAIKYDRPVPVSGEEGIDALRIALGAVDSYKNDQPVKLIK